MGTGILDEVRDVVAERGESYDDPTADFLRIAINWSLRLRKEVTPIDVAWMMACGLKDSRAMHTPTGRDHRLDAVGYLHCLDLIVDKWENDAFYKDNWNSIIQGMYGLGLLNTTVTPEEYERLLEE